MTWNTTKLDLYLWISYSQFLIGEEANDGKDYYIISKPLVLRHTSTSNEPGTNNVHIVDQTHNGVFRTCSSMMAYLRQGILKGEVSLYCWPPVWLVWNQLYNNWQFFIYLQNRLIQTSKTGGQWYSDTSPFSFPCLRYKHSPTIS